MSTSRTAVSGRYTLLQMLGAIVAVATAMCVVLPSAELPMASSPAADEFPTTVGFYRLEFESRVDPYDVVRTVQRHELGELYDVVCESDRTVVYTGLWMSTADDPEDLIVVFDGLAQRPRSIEPCKVPYHPEIKRLRPDTHDGTVAAK